MSCISIPVGHCKLEHHFLATRLDSALLQAGKVDLVVHQRDQEDYSASPAGIWKVGTNMF